MIETAYLIELRKRLLIAFATIVIIFLPLAFFAKELYQLLALPLLRHLPEGHSLIATGIASPFLAPFKFAFFIALFCAIPILLYQTWAFIAPALYKNEKRLIFPLLFSSTLLFYCGSLFAYFIVLPLVLNFFIQIAPDGVKVLPDITEYLNFALKLFFAFGLAFEVPIATMLIVKTGIASIESLSNKRPFIIVFAFVIGMLLTPPDVISQVLLAVPIWLLFELGLILARIFIKPASTTRSVI